MTFFLCCCWSLFRIIIPEIECMQSHISKVCHWEDDLPFTFVCVKMFLPALYFRVCKCFHLPYTFVCVKMFLLALFFHVCKCFYSPFTFVCVKMFLFALYFCLWRFCMLFGFHSNSAILFFEASLQTSFKMFEFR